MMLYQIYHSTQFFYSHEVAFSHNLIRLKPRNTPFQTLIDYTLSSNTVLSEIDDYDDYFGNHLSHLLIREAHHDLKVIAQSCVRIDEDAIEEHQLLSQRAKEVSYSKALEQFNNREMNLIDIKQFCLQSPHIPIVSKEIQGYVKRSFLPQRSLYESVQEFMERIFNDFEFQADFSDITTPIDEVFRERKGVCQDFAHLAIGALRSLGLPARYVSGYLETLPPEGEQKLFGADASHAWFSVFIPGFGWFDFDPTNNIIPSKQHIVLGYGRDYGDIAPMQGVVFGSGNSHLNVMVDVSREEEGE